MLNIFIYTLIPSRPLFEIIASSLVRGGSAGWCVEWCCSGGWTSQVLVDGEGTANNRCSGLGAILLKPSSKDRATRFSTNTFCICA
jgi:hypothetical protein